MKDLLNPSFETIRLALNDEQKCISLQNVQWIHVDGPKSYVDMSEIITFMESLSVATFPVPEEALSLNNFSGLRSLT